MAENSTKIVSEEYQIPNITSELLTVMFLDVVGYTDRTTRLSREEFNQFHDIFDSLTIPLVKKFSGKIIKKIGDAFLITFTSPTNAILCAMELQKKFDYYNEAPEVSDKLEIRIAVDNGEVLLRDNDVYGEAVNIASRVESLTPPKRIYFTEAVCRAMNKKEIPFLEVGPRQLKGIHSPIKIFKVKKHEDDIEMYKELAIDLAMGLILIALVLFLVKYLYFNTNLVEILRGEIERLF